MKRITGLTVTDFRGFYGTHPVTLDGDFVLVHGPNGSGKTALLQAIEFAFTGDVEDLRRYDSDYPLCLQSEGGRNGLSTVLHGLDQRNEAIPITQNLHNHQLPKDSDPTVAAQQFFRDRANLSQPRLGRLLDIYKHPVERKGDDPLIIGILRELLGLSITENIENGLDVNKDRRRIHKESASVQRLDREIADIEHEKGVEERQIAHAREQWRRETQALEAAYKNLFQSSPFITIRDTSDVSRIEEYVLSSIPAEGNAERLLQSASLTRQSVKRLTTLRDSVNQDLPTNEDDIKGRLADLQSDIREGRNAIGEALQTVLTEVSDPHWTEYDYQGTNPERELTHLSTSLNDEHRSLANRIEELREKATRRDEIVSQLDSYSDEERRLEEVSIRAQRNQKKRRILEHALPQIEDTNVCPVCSRDYSETANANLVDHVREELSDLGANLKILQEQIDAAESRQKEERRLWADLNDLTAQLGAEDSRLTGFLTRYEVLSRGYKELQKWQQRASDILHEEQTITDLQGQQEAVGRIREQEHYLKGQLEELSRENGIALPSESTFSIEQIAESLASQLENHAENIGEYSRIRREVVESAQRAAESAAEFTRHNDRLSSLSDRFDELQKAKGRFDKVRKAAKNLGRAAEKTEDSTINEVINSDLNGVWTDIFRRMARSEAYVPRLNGIYRRRGTAEARYETKSPNGSGFDNPASILSTGNLNTAALSLFISLNLIHRAPINTIILDDPVQNMDDIHAIEFANLLKEIRAQTDRQIVLATHDRGLFEYLRTELSPVNKDQSLAIVETGWSDSEPCIRSETVRYREETVRVA